VLQDLKTKLIKATTTRYNALNLQGMLLKGLTYEEGTVRPNERKLNFKHGNVWHVNAKVNLKDASSVKFFPRLKFHGSVDHWDRYVTVQHIISSLKETDNYVQRESFEQSIREYFMDPMEPGTLTDDQFASAPVSVTDKILNRIDSPYIHVPEFGPTMNYFFDSTAVEVFECKFKSRPSNFIHHTTSRIWVGPCMPRTLCRVHPEDLLLVFGIVIQVVSEDNNRKEMTHNVLEILMVPAEIAVAKFDWGEPYDDETLLFKHGIYKNMTKGVATADEFILRKTDIFENVRKYRLLIGVDNDAPIWSWDSDANGILDVEDTISQRITNIEMALKDILSAPIDSGASTALRDFIVKHMPAEFKCQYFQVKGRNIQEDAEHVYECGLGAFLRSAIKQQFLIQIYRNFAYALISQFLIHFHNEKHPPFKVSNFDGLRYVYESIRTIEAMYELMNDVQTRKNNYEQTVDAHKMISSMLFESYGIFPLSFQLSKFQSYHDERALLYRMMEIIYQLYGKIVNIMHKEDADYAEKMDLETVNDEDDMRQGHEHLHKLKDRMSQFYDTVEKAVDAGMGNDFHRVGTKKESRVRLSIRTGCSIAIATFIRDVKHTVNLGVNVSLDEFAAEDYPRPCTVAELCMPVTSSTLNCNVDLSDLKNVSPWLFQLYKSYYPYNIDNFPRTSKLQNQTIPFMPLERCIEDRRFMQERNGFHVVKPDPKDPKKFIELVTAETTCFTRLTVDTDQKKIMMHIMSKYAAPSKEVQPIHDALQNITNNAMNLARPRASSATSYFKLQSVRQEAVKAVSYKINEAMMQLKETADKNSKLKDYVVRTHVIQRCKDTFLEKMAIYKTGFAPENYRQGDRFHVTCTYKAEQHNLMTKLMWKVKKSEPNDMHTYTVEISASKGDVFHDASGPQSTYRIRLIGYMRHSPSNVVSRPSEFTLEFVLLPFHKSEVTQDNDFVDDVKTYTNKAIQLLLDLSKRFDTLAHTPYILNAQANNFITEVSNYALHWLRHIFMRLQTHYAESQKNVNEYMRHYVTMNDLQVAVSFGEDLGSITETYFVILRCEIQTDSVRFMVGVEKEGTNKLVEKEKNVMVTNNGKSEPFMISKRLFDMHLDYRDNGNNSKGHEEYDAYVRNGLIAAEELVISMAKFAEPESKKESEKNRTIHTWIVGFSGLRLKKIVRLLGETKDPPEYSNEPFESSKDVPPPQADVSPQVTSRDRALPSTAGAFNTKINMLGAKEDMDDDFTLDFHKIYARLTAPKPYIMITSGNTIVQWTGFQSNKGFVLSVYLLDSKSKPTEIQSSRLPYLLPFPATTSNFIEFQMARKMLDTLLRICKDFDIYINPPVTNTDATKPPNKSIVITRLKPRDYIPPQNAKTDGSARGGAVGGGNTSARGNGEEAAGGGGDNEEAGEQMDATASTNKGSAEDDLQSDRTKKSRSADGRPQTAPAGGGRIVPPVPPFANFPPAAGRGENNEDVNTYSTVSSGRPGAGGGDEDMSTAKSNASRAADSAAALEQAKRPKSAVADSTPRDETVEMAQAKAARAAEEAAAALDAKKQRQTAPEFTPRNDEIEMEQAKAARAAEEAAAALDAKKQRQTAPEFTPRNDEIEMEQAKAARAAEEAAAALDAKKQRQETNAEPPPAPAQSVAPRTLEDDDEESLTTEQDSANLAPPSKKAATAQSSANQSDSVEPSSSDAVQDVVTMDEVREKKSREAREADEQAAAEAARAAQMNDGSLQVDELDENKESAAPAAKKPAVNHTPVPKPSQTGKLKAAGTSNTAPGRPTAKSAWADNGNSGDQPVITSKSVKESRAGQSQPAKGTEAYLKRQEAAKAQKEREKGKDYLPNKKPTFDPNAAKATAAKTASSTPVEAIKPAKQRKPGDPEELPSSVQPSWAKPTSPGAERGGSAPSALDVSPTAKSSVRPSWRAKRRPDNMTNNPSPTSRARLNGPGEKPGQLKWPTGEQTDATGEDLPTADHEQLGDANSETSAEYKSDEEMEAAPAAPAGSAPQDSTKTASKSRFFDLDDVLARFSLSI
jgi:hypothetical protein